MNLLSEALRHLSKSVPNHRHAALLEEAAREAGKLERPIDEDVADFHRRFGHPAPALPVMPKKAVMDFRIKLIREECDELCAAIESRDLSHVIQEAVDLIYVVLGTLVVCGVRLAPFWATVQSSNMAKVPNPAGGKPLKPEGWVRPAIMVTWFDEEEREVKPS
jgi:predicted HAD superfamily Cof-like phosphohydrolase